MITMLQAKEILGEKNVFGPDEWKKFFGNKFQLTTIPEIPWSRAELEKPAIKQEHFLFLGLDVLGGEPLTLLMWKKLYQEAKDPDQPHFTPNVYISEYDRSTCRLRWYLMPLGHVEGASSDLEKQLYLLPLEYGVAECVERVTANILYFLLNKKYFDLYNGARCGREVVSGSGRSLTIDEGGHIEEYLDFNAWVEDNQGEGIAASREEKAREKPTTTIQEAKEYLGANNVFGPDEWLKFFPGKVSFSNDQRNEVGEIPWPKSILVNPTLTQDVKKEHFLFLGLKKLEFEKNESDLNLFIWLKLYGGNRHPKFRNPKQLYNWYISDCHRPGILMLGTPDHFAYHTCDFRWYFMPKGVLESSIGREYRDIPKPSEYAVVKAIEVVTANFLYYLLNQKYLDMLTQVARTSETNKERSSVCVRANPSDGLIVEFEQPNKYFGVALSREISRNAIAAQAQSRDLRTVESLIKDLQHAWDRHADAPEGLSPDFNAVLPPEKPLVNMGVLAVVPLLALLEHGLVDYERQAVYRILVGIGSPAVEPAISLLKHENHDMRTYAAKALGELKDARAVEPLIYALKDENYQVRYGSAIALGHLGDARAVEPLITALKDENKSVCAFAANALGKLEDARAVEPLMIALKDEDRQVRAYAAGALYELKDIRSVETFITALQDEDKDVRSTAAKALGEMKDVRAVVPLFGALKDKDAWVRTFAILALWGGKDARAVEPLAAMLTDEDNDVRHLAAQALGGMGDARAVEPLLAALRSGQGYYVEKALGELKDQGAFEPLVEMLKAADPLHRASAARALGKTQDERAVEPLIAALKDEHRNVRTDAAQALGELKDARAVEPLITALKDEDKYVREAAAKALGELKDARAVEPLIAALKNDDKDMRVVAAKILGEFKDSRALEPLVAMLKEDKENYNRGAAAQVLGELMDDRAVEPLKAALSDGSDHVRYYAKKALEKFHPGEQEVAEKKDAPTTTAQDQEYAKAVSPASPAPKPSSKPSRKVILGCALVAVIIFVVVCLGFLWVINKNPVAPTTTPVGGETSSSEAVPSAPSLGAATSTSPAPLLPTAIGGGTGRLAFSAEVNGNHDIYITDADGSNPIRLTSHEAWDWAPAWSPDGKQIAFVSVRDGNADIYVMDTDGANVKRLTVNETYEVSPAWSPDGRTIAYVSDRDEPDVNGCENSTAGCNFNIYVIKLDTLSEARLTDALSPEEGPSWSPDGKRIAFFSTRDGNTDIYVMNADGSGLMRLTEDPLYEWDPAWSPDGMHIAFMSFIDDHNDIYWVDADGSNITRLTNDTADNSAPAWSPDGQHLAFHSTTPDGSTTICTMDVNGANKVCMADNTLITALEPAWQP